MTFEEENKRKDIAKELTMTVISRHFLYTYGKKGYTYKTVRLPTNDGKCQQCGIRRRFKMAPCELVEAIEKRLIAQLEEEGTSSTFQKAGEVLEKLEQLGRVAVHKWIDRETYLYESLRRRTKYIANYDTFCL